MWYVVDSQGNRVAGSDGATKKEAKGAFLEKMKSLGVVSVRGAQNGPHMWLWWHNQGFRVRRER